MNRAAFVLLLLCGAGPLSGQAARVLVAGEPLRSAPASTVLATLSQGVALQVGAPRGGWREATLEGWIPVAAVRGDVASSGVVVTAAAGEDLRLAAGGAVAARVPPGVFLERIGGDASWVRVRRTGWVRDRSVRIEAGMPLPAAAPVKGAPAAPAAATADFAPPTAARAGARAGDGGAIIMANPGSDTLASVPAFTPLEVLGRQGGWTRVRVEGWVWTGTLAGAADAAGVLSDVTAAALVANPDTYKGRVIAWSVQFIALRTAEPLRTDFQPGERFLLTRGPARESGFVYIAVPPRLLTAAQALQPLQRIQVLARVRNGRSQLMGAPVLELIELH